MFEFGYAARSRESRLKSLVHFRRAAARSGSSRYTTSLKLEPTSLASPGSVLAGLRHCFSFIALIRDICHTNLKTKKNINGRPHSIDCCSDEALLVSRIDCSTNLSAQGVFTRYVLPSNHENCNEWHRL